MSLLLQLLLSLLFSSSDFSLVSSANSITLSLSRVDPLPSTTSKKPLDNLKYHAAASLARAHHLKYPNAHTSLYPSSYGEYTAVLSFGTPPQNLSFIMDTGSSLVWFPCTTKYTCTHCNIPKGDQYPFIPQHSSSYKNITCNSQQCEWLFPGHKCKNPTGTCGYIIPYGSGNTTGLLVSESLTIPGLSVPNFTAGCSVSSADLPPGGIVGFGRDRGSLPAQLGLKAFSYCLVSHYFDDITTASSDLVLMTTTPGSGSSKRPSTKIQYTPFVSNTAAFPDYYYVWLQNISIGGVDLKVPAKYLVLDKKGNGGTIVGSGTAFTHMEKPVFDLVFKELDNKVVKKYRRARNIEKEIGLESCYNVGKNKPQLPQLTLHFEGGAEMFLPLDNYFSYADDSVVCMTIKTYGEVGWGPAIILGNYLQQDYYMEYDLENNRLGILQHKCSKST